MPFEIASGVLLVALVGAIVIADAGRRGARCRRLAQQIPLEHFIVLSGILFSIGVYGVLSRRNAVLC